MSDNTLLIFIKNPEAGKVKTRLSRDIGKQQAVQIYRLFVEAILTSVQDKNFKRIVFYYPPSGKDEIVGWLGRFRLELAPQTGRDLGERLTCAFKMAFNNGAKRVVAIGSDSPTLNTGTVLEAFRELENKDCVIGPTHDGGYYLLGLSHFYGEIFGHTEWSTNRAFKKTLDIIDRLKLSYGVLGRDFDVDTIEDLRVLKKILLDRRKVGLADLESLLEAILRLRSV